MNNTYNNNLLRFNDNILTNINNRADIEINTNSYESSPRGCQQGTNEVDGRNAQSLKQLCNIYSVSNQRNKSPLFKKKVNYNCLKINNLGRKKNNNKV